MAPKKAKTKAKTKSKRATASASTLGAQDTADRLALIEQAKEMRLLIKSEESAFNDFQQQRERINYFWIVERKNLEERTAQLRNKERERQEMEEKYQFEIKNYEQRIKHLLHEQHQEINEMKQGELSLQTTQDAHRDTKHEIKSDNRHLQAEGNMSDIAHYQYMKSLKHEQDEKLSNLRHQYERYAKDIQQKYERKRKVVRDRLEAQRKADTQQIEERKNLHIGHLMSAHEKAFREIKNYYNDITHSNLDLIKSLKEQVADLKKKEAQDEKLMFEVSQENKRMSEPLKRALQDVEALRKRFQQYQCDKSVLRDTKAELLVLEEQFATCSWEHEVLTQRLLQVGKEYQDLNNALQNTIYEVQRKNGFKNLMLEKQMSALRHTLDHKSAEMHELLMHAKLDPVIVDRKGQLDNVIQNKQQTRYELEQYSTRISAMQKALRQTVQSKLSEYGLTLDELGYDIQAATKKSEIDHRASISQSTLERSHHED
ncbi:unnamed protein product [Albugo candida]|uniref:Growth arrest-specific protein 8 domain-containing protein n=1 Tax=Albugo candida TaxID=65357 RepID=A0A024GJX0_9STRA|nr:unnamed protein product [Albugo candida]|eukprot:CCI47062.1 unnamed protein product [Albugo candida]